MLSVHLASTGQDTSSTLKVTKLICTSTCMLIPVSVSDLEHIVGQHADVREGTKEGRNKVDAVNEFGGSSFVPNPFTSISVLLCSWYK